MHEDQVRRKVFILVDGGFCQCGRGGDGTNENREVATQFCSGGDVAADLWGIEWMRAKGSADFPPP